MKALLTILLLSVCSICFGQSGIIDLPDTINQRLNGTINFVPANGDIWMNADITNCYSLNIAVTQFDIKPTEQEFIKWFKSLVSEQKLNEFQRELVFSNRCSNKIEVRAGRINLTFDILRALIYQQ